MTERVPTQKVAAVSITVLMLVAGIAGFVVFETQTVSGEVPFISSIEISYDDTTETQQNSDIAADNAGNLYVVLEDHNGADFDIYFTNSSDGGVNWQFPDVMVSEGTNGQTEPSIAVNAATGVIYVAWQDNRGGDRNISFANSTDGGATWSSPHMQINDDLGVEDQGTPDILVDSSGTIHAVWEDRRNGDWDIYYSKSTDGGDTWDINRKVSDTADRQRYPSVAVAPGSNIYVAWQDDRAGALTNYDIYCANSTDGGQIWGTDNKVSADASIATQEHPSITVDNGGTLYAVWEDFIGGNFDIYSARSTDGGYSWSTNVVVNDALNSNQMSPDITVGAGVLHVVWEDPRSGDPDIYYANSTNGGTNWGTNIRVDDDVGTDSQNAPSIALSSSITVNIVWQDNRDGDLDIYYSKTLPAVVVLTIDRIFISREADGSSDWVSDGIYKINDLDVFYAVGWNDSLNVFVSLVSVDWSVLGSIGTVNPGLGTSTTFNATTQGIGQVSAYRLPYGTNVTGLLTVSGDPIDRIFISLSPTGSSGWIGNQFYTVSDTQTFYAVGWNDTLNQSVTLVDVAWTTTNALVGDVTTPGNSTTFSANGDGICTVTATHGTYGTNDTGKLTVTSYNIDRIFVSLSPTGNSGWVDDQTYPEGDSAVFYACAWNDTSNVFVKLVDSSWSSDTPSVGDVDAQGTSTTFSALSTGTCKVTAYNATFGSNQTGNLKVFELEIDEILISPSPDGTGGWVDGGSYDIEETDIFYATAWNSSYNEFMGLVDATWAISDDSVATIETSGLWINFTALQVAADSTCFVTAEYSGMQNSTGTLNVLAPAIDYIIIRDAPNDGGNVLDTATFEVDDQAIYYAAGYNNIVGYLGDVSQATWGVTNSIGTVNPVAGNSTTFTATDSGVGKITVSYNGITNESGNIIVDILGDIPPSKPGQPTLEVKGKDKIEITWPANTEVDLKEYVVQRSESSDGPWTNVTTVNVGTTTYLDSGLSPDTSYYYRIIAIDNAGNPSDPSQAVSVTTEKEGDGNGDGDFPWILIVLLIVIIMIVVFLLIFMMKKKGTSGGGEAEI